MKRFLFFTIFFISVLGFAQKTQTFPKYGFQVSCNCNLYENTTFKKMASGKVQVVEALVCATSDVSPAIYNLNIYHDNASSSQQFHSKYQRDLSNSGISYRTTSISGISATEYSFSQNGVPAKAVVFYQSGKSYLLQVTANSNLESKFQSFKTSFKTISKANNQRNAFANREKVRNLEDQVLLKLKKIDAYLMNVKNPSTLDTYKITYVSGVYEVLTSSLKADFSDEVVTIELVKYYKEALADFKNWGY